MFGAAIVSRETAAYWERQSFAGALQQVAQIAPKINTVLDVGAAHGDWSVRCAEILPGARYALFEPLVEYRQQLDVALTRIPSGDIYFTGLGRESGERLMHVHPDLVGSSFYLEDEKSDVNGSERTVAINTLDNACGTYSLNPPYLLKADVQGAELDVLAGGITTLKSCEFVVLETSFFEFYENRVTVIDVIEFMADAGFALYDIFGLSHRPLDNALAQADLCFVPRDGPFRKQHFFATNDQRRAVTERLAHLNATVNR
jgi:FkbM family methyltransferase